MNTIKLGSIQGLNFFGWYINYDTEIIVVNPYSFPNSSDYDYFIPLIPYPKDIMTAGLSFVPCGLGLINQQEVYYDLSKNAESNIAKALTLISNLLPLRLVMPNAVSVHNRILKYSSKTKVTTQKQDKQLKAFKEGFLM